MYGFELYFQEFFEKKIDRVVALANSSKSIILPFENGGNSHEFGMFRLLPIQIVVTQPGAT